MRVHYSPEFIKKLKKTNVRVRKSFKERIRAFSKNPNDPILNNHVLEREWEGHRSIDITSDWRAIYEEVIVKDEVVADFIALGTHDQLYK